jgi:hypothetical protein
VVELELEMRVAGRGRVTGCGVGVEGRGLVVVGRVPWRGFWLLALELSS